MSTNILPIISYDTGWVDGYLTTSGSIGYDTNGDMTSPFCEVVSEAVRYVVSFSYDLPSPHPGWIAICFYNSSKSKISDRIVSESSASSIPTNITGYVPSGTAYIRVCSSNLADGTNVSASCVMSFAWYVDSEGNLTNDELRELLPPMQKPYPLSLWRVENGVLTNGLLAKFPADAGAFENASRLSRVAIPESVKVIGDTAFRGTALTVVRIAADCTSGEESFPENCRILRYPAHTHGQLTDGGGRVVLDRQGRRIYARRIDNG